MLDLLIEQGFISSSQDTVVFDEFSLISGLISNYLTAQNVTYRNTENCWVYTHFHTKDLLHANVCIIVEYILCLPDSNAPV